MSGQSALNSDDLIAELDALLGAGVAEPPPLHAPAPQPAPMESEPDSFPAPLPETFAEAEAEPPWDVEDPLASTEAPAPRSPRSKKVLVVDDSKDYRDVVRYLLEQAGYDVVEAVDGAEGLKEALAEFPDLVVVDFNMPNMNGYELVMELRASFELRRVPIIMFTGASNREHLKKMGMDISAFLDKPISNAELLNAVNAAAGGPPGADRRRVGGDWVSRNRRGRRARRLPGSQQGRPGRAGKGSPRLPR